MSCCINTSILWPFALLEHCSCFLGSHHLAPRVLRHPPLLHQEIWCHPHDLHLQVCQKVFLSFIILAAFLSSLSTDCFSSIWRPFFMSHSQPCYPLLKCHFLLLMPVLLASDPQNTFVLTLLLFSLCVSFPWASTELVEFLFKTPLSSFLQKMLDNQLLA